MRKKGKEYHKNLEVTKFSNEIDKKMKYFLLDWYHDYIILSLEILVQHIVEVTVERIMVKYQINGEGTHQKKELTKWLNDEKRHCYLPQLFSK